MSIPYSTITTQHHIDINRSIPPSSTPIFPDPPKYPGILVNHTISLSVGSGYCPEGAVEGSTNAAGWLPLLLDGERLDPRVSSVRWNTHWELQPTVEENMCFLRSRKRRNCSPIVSFSAPNCLTPSLEILRGFVSSLGPDLRSLRLGYLSAFDARKWESLIVRSIIHFHTWNTSAWTSTTGLH